MNKKSTMTRVKQMSAASKARTSLHGIADDLPRRPFVVYKPSAQLRAAEARAAELFAFPSWKPDL